MSRRERVHELVDRLMEYMEARAQLRECYDKCDSSPDYFCRDLADERDRALDSLVKALNEFMGEAASREPA